MDSTIPPMVPQPLGVVEMARLAGGRVDLKQSAAVISASWGVLGWPSERHSFAATVRAVRSKMESLARTDLNDVTTHLRWLENPEVSMWKYIPWLLKYAEAIVEYNQRFIGLLRTISEKLSREDHLENHDVPRIVLSFGGMEMRNNLRGLDEAYGLVSRSLGLDEHVDSLGLRDLHSGLEQIERAVGAVVKKVTEVCLDFLKQEDCTSKFQQVDSNDSLPMAMD